jgi:peptide/nickel transport system permease protein
MLLIIPGKKIFVHGPGRILQRLVMATLCVTIFIVGGVGYGILFTFALFLWEPKISKDWSHRNLQIYRFGLIGTVLLLMVLEAGWLSYFGIALPFTLFIPTVGLYLLNLGFPWISFAALAFLIPLFLLMPRVFQMVWNLKPNIESFWREFLHHKMGMVGLVIISSIVLMAVLAPLIAPYHWGEGSLQIEDLLQPPSAEHIFGTNHRGEDIFSRMIYGSQISLLVGFAASVVAVFLGTFIGLISGYYGGIVDTVLMRITDMFLCLPTLPLMLIFLVIFGQGLQNVIVVIAILGWTGTARMVRSEALSLRERPLTEAAHALGASDNYILIKHIMPNTFPLILANMILGVVNAILSEAGIAFLGFVDIHGQPSWGILLHWAWKNAALLGNRWWWFIPPGLLILLTTLGFVFVSHTADKVVNPRLRGRQ